jgi:hypothetical protein
LARAPLALTAVIAIVSSRRGRHRRTGYAGRAWLAMWIGLGAVVAARDPARPTGLALIGWDFAVARSGALLLRCWPYCTVSCSGCAVQRPQPVEGALGHVVFVQPMPATCFAPSPYVFAAPGPFSRTRRWTAWPARVVCAADVVAGVCCADDCPRLGRPAAGVSRSSVPTAPAVVRDAGQPESTVSASPSRSSPWRS